MRSKIPTKSLTQRVIIEINELEDRLWLHGITNKGLVFGGIFRQVRFLRAQLNFQIKRVGRERPHTWKEKYTADERRLINRSIGPE